MPHVGLVGLALIVAGAVIVGIVVVATGHRRGLLWERSQTSALQQLLAIVGGLSIGLGIWCLGAAAQPEGPTRIPTPWAALEAAVQLVLNGGWLDILASSARVFIGFGLAAAASMLLAIAVSLHALTTRAAAPVLGFIRYIPPTAFTALLVIYFGIGEVYKIAVIFVGVFFFNFRMTLDHLQDFDVRYIELAKLSGSAFRRRHDRLWLYSKTVIPASWPKFWDMLRINLSFSWTFLVVAETVGASYGLGSRLYLAQRFFRVEEVFGCILLFGLIGLIVDQSMDRGKRLLFPWHEDAVSR